MVTTFRRTTTPGAPSAQPTIWRTDDPQALRRQLEQQEQALVTLFASKWPRLRERAVLPRLQAYPVAAGENLLAETASGDVTCLLPPITGAVLGSVCAVTKLSSANAVLLAVPRPDRILPPSTPLVHIDGTDRTAAPLRLVAPGTRLYVATSLGWWSTSVGSDSGTYIPSTSSASGVTVNTVRPAHWTRVGNVVTVAWRFQVTDSASGAKSFRMSLPVPRVGNFPNATDHCHGVGSGGPTDNRTDVRVLPVSGAQLAELNVNDSSSTGGRTWLGTLTYSLTDS